MANLSSTHACHQTVVERMLCSLLKRKAKTEVPYQQGLAAVAAANGCLDWCDSLSSQMWSLFQQVAINADCFQVHLHVLEFA